VGTTADVRIPGDAEPVEVGPGRHEWRRPDPWHGDGRPELGTVRDIVDHEPAWRQVVGAARDAGLVRGEEEAAERLEAFLDAPAPALVDALAPHGLAEGAEALRARLAGLLDG
jgi:alpha-L-rhamnosidase